MNEQKQSAVLLVILVVAGFWSCSTLTVRKAKADTIPHGFRFTEEPSGKDIAPFPYGGLSQCPDPPTPFISQHLRPDACHYTTRDRMRELYQEAMEYPYDVTRPVTISLEWADYEIQGKYLLLKPKGWGKQ
jgi:hypothetical protein